jgi:cell division protein FtsB
MLRTFFSLLVTLALVGMIVWLGRLVVDSRHQVASQEAEKRALQARLDDVVQKNQHIQDVVAKAHLYQERLVAVRERLNMSLPNEEVVMVYRDTASAIASSASQVVASSSWTKWFGWVLQKTGLRD